MLSRRCVEQWKSMRVHVNYFCAALLWTRLSSRWLVVVWSFACLLQQANNWSRFFRMWLQESHSKSTIISASCWLRKVIAMSVVPFLCSKHRLLSSKFLRIINFPILLFSGKNTIYDNEKFLVVPDWKEYVSKIAERILADPSGDGYVLLLAVDFTFCV